MRRRLLLSTLAVAIAVVMVFAIPLGYVQAGSIRQRAKEAVQDDTARILAALEQEVNRGRKISAVMLTPLITPGTYVVVESPDLQRPIEAGTDPRRMTDPATDDGPLQVGVVVDQDETYAFSLVGDKRTDENGERVPGTKVTVMRPTGGTTKDIWQAWLITAGVGALAVAAAAGLALLLARRLSGPLVDLAKTAESLGGGDLRPRQRRYGVAELDQVADVLDDSAVRISRMLAAERHFAANASHQLRTPLTALSMRVEEMAHAADLTEVKEEAEVALAQIERLTGVVEDLLRGSRVGSASTVMINVDVAIKQQLTEWRPPYEHAGRRIVTNGRPGLVALATPGRLAQSLAVLLENALVHGAGDVQVTTRAIGGKVIIEVADEGPGIPSALVPRIFERRVSGHEGTGLGLALARQLVEADGGRLELTGYYPAVFSIFLPRGTVAPRRPSIRSEPATAADGAAPARANRRGSSARGHAAANGEVRANPTDGNAAEVPAAPAAHVSTGGPARQR